MIVHGRTREKAEAARERTGAAEVAVADLASFAQVRRMIEAIDGPLDGLVNNAGIGYGTAPSRGDRTEDGHEPTWQVNFLSAFLLTEGLREQLGGGRVVHVSSRRALERRGRPRAARRAALRDALRAVEDRAGDARPRAGRALGADGGPAVNACSPGWIATKMGGSGGGALQDGADTPVWMLTEPSLDGVTGRYFWQRREEEPNPQTEDADARRRLVELAQAAVRA